MRWLDRIRLRWRIARLTARVYLIERAIRKGHLAGVQPSRITRHTGGR